ncbi:DUF6634 family protein [Methylobacterium sp. J-077]|uniref:DUF6634 family protein n=1 Tax=Methylobacterium sp. J-077 TaxID=2836656 RepID=UPI001FBB022F|nr:DUF6634 family protein [Methylobacterium sp. J-077]MCJ2121774.1 hypothetical protein [Methylobacterium sp. J-077]
MSILNRGPGPFPELTHRASKYRALAEDLERIARGEHPGELDLRDAPYLFDWQLFLMPLPYLLGTVFGHPKIEDGHICRTSELITFDPVTGYARTFSRFYRLGSPAPKDGIQ